MKKLNSIFALLLTIVLFSCSNTDEMSRNDAGYLTISVSAVSTTHNMGTRVIPAEYNAKQMAVEILDASGNIVEQTDDASMWDNKVITLLAGTYTVNVHSNNWDGNDSGRDVPFYAGSATVTISANEKSEANVVCTLANVKVSVEFDASVAEKFKSAYVEVSSAVSNILPQTFTLGDEATLASAYFPVGNLTATLHITNNAGKEYTKETALTDVKARDHYILKYSVAASGNGEFTVTADDTETTYTYNFFVPANPSEDIQTSSAAPDAWATSVTLESTIEESKVEIADDSNLYFQLKADDEEEWTMVPAEAVTESAVKRRLAPAKVGATYRAKVTGLNPGTKYSYRLVYVENEETTYVGTTETFTTETAEQLPNSGFEDWCTVSGLNYACTSDQQASNLFWGSSNVNAVVTKINGASGTDDTHSGGKAALMQSKYVNVLGIKKFAAASLFSGEMPKVSGTNGASINFGRPFTSRPTGLKGFYKYSTDKVNRTATLTMPDGSAVPLTTDDNDLWSCYIALTTEPYTFDNSSQAQLNSTTKDFKSGTDPTVIAYGEMKDADCVTADDWTEFSFDLHYFDTTTKPSYIIIVMSSSKYGDYFCGCDNSKLYIDDLELVYGEPEQ